MSWFRYTGAERGVEVIPGFQPVDLADEELRAQVRIYLTQWDSPALALARLLLSTPEDERPDVDELTPAEVESLLLEIALEKFVADGHYAPGEGALPQDIEERLAASGVERAGEATGEERTVAEVPLGETALLEAEE